MYVLERNKLQAHTLRHALSRSLNFVLCTTCQATHSNIYLNLPDWEPIAPFAPKAGPEAESSTSSRIPLDQQSRNTKIGNIAEGKP